MKKDILVVHGNTDDANILGTSEHLFNSVDYLTYNDSDTRKLFDIEAEYASIIFVNLSPEKIAEFVSKYYEFLPDSLVIDSKIDHDRLDFDTDLLDTFQFFVYHTPNELIPAILKSFV